MSKIIFVCFYLSTILIPVLGQENRKLGYTIRMLNFDWMPDNNLILTITKFDKSRKTSPVSMVYLFDIQKRVFNLLIDNAGRPSHSPDGRWIAYEKKLSDEKSDIHIFNVATKATEAQFLKV